MGDAEKICVLCGESCAGQPRIRNEQGRYAHKACIASKEEQEPALYEDAGLDDLFDDLAPEDQNTIGAANACPGCGQPMGEDAIVCMGCGHNRESGKQLRTSASKDRAIKESKVASASTEMMSSVVSQLVMPIIGGCVGGAIGASLWAAIAFYGQIRLGLLAWAVGALVAVGVNVGSRHTGGVVYGMIAAAITIGSVVSGHYITASLLVSQYLEMLEPEDVSADMAMGTVVVWDVIAEWVERGEEVPWTRKWKTWEFAEWPEDFSRVIIAETQERWDGMEFDEQVEIRIEIASVTRANSPFIEHDMIETGFVYLLLQPLNIIYLTLAVGSAYIVSSKG